MKPRIVFGIISAMQKPSTVAQLAQSLAPHTVLIHHDYRKQPDFHIDLPNVKFVPDPKETGWGNWGFSDGIYHTLQHCINELEFDYFQLMSPTCLPIRPLAEFEDFLQTSDCEVHGDFFDISSSKEMTMVFGARCYAPNRTARIMALRQAQQWYFGSEQAVQQLVSLSIRIRAKPEQRGPLDALKEDIAWQITKLARKGFCFPHPFNDRFRPYIGSTWIGLSRRAAVFLANKRHDPRVDSYFSRLPIVDEIMFPTFLANSEFKVGPGNHAVNTFSVAGNPQWITDADFDRMIETSMFFARKFPDDYDAPIRKRALRHLQDQI